MALNAKVKAVPAKVSKILHAHLDKPPFLLNIGYRSVIGKLNYLLQRAFFICAHLLSASGSHNNTKN